ncbi:(Lyso)-N-acylphosphatidylethanolamine lipase isoform X2 [Phymastichus coffea]|nr:(Lyso)-N-acylphosphatidylethanolamine lipase isoform X2 [Phymastichus coffea]
MVLRNAEKKILSYLKTVYRGTYVDIGPVVGPAADKIWTISLNEESPKTPVVLLHGFAAGVALWALNLDTLAKYRPVYAIDLLGFGRSSRPNFSKDAEEAENQFIRSVEEWRKQMQLDKVVLLGHSMGGFLAASYAIQHPERVKHLILAEPWGFTEKPPETEKKVQVPLWVKAIAYLVQPLNPLWAVRFAGPYGQRLIETMRPDLMRKFAPVSNNDPTIIAQYIHQCNAQTPSGESAFHAMMQGFIWAKNPMLKRIDKIDPEIPITVLYGSKSWIDNSGEKIKNSRPSSYVNVQIINGSGHHIYVDKSDIFNRCVLEAAALSEKYEKLTNTMNARTEFKNNPIMVENKTEVRREQLDNIAEAERPRSS